MTSFQVFAEIDRIAQRSHQPSVRRVHVCAIFLDQCVVLPLGGAEDSLPSFALQRVRKRSACGGTVVKTDWRTMTHLDGPRA